MGTQAPRQVDYVLEIVDEIPDRSIPRSPLEDTLEQIVARYEQMGDNAKPINAVIGLYKNGSASTAAANVLRQRHGTQEVEGWRFETRRLTRDVKAEDGTVTGQEEVTGLYVSYDPTKAVPGGREMWDQKMKDRAAKLEQARKDREAAKANPANASQASPSSQPGTGNTADAAANQQASPAATATPAQTGTATAAGTATAQPEGAPPTPPQTATATKVSGAPDTSGNKAQTTQPAVKK